MQPANDAPPHTAPGGPLLKQPAEVPAFSDLIPPSQEFSQSGLEALVNEFTNLSIPEVSRPVSESSDESSIYREQIEKLRQLISQLQKQLKDEQARNRGLEILSTCGHEQQIENKRLKVQIASYKTQVADLEKRLGQVDRDELNSYHQSVKDHSVLPAVSVESFDNLVRENTRLQQKIQRMEVDQAAAMSSKDEAIRQLQMRIEQQASTLPSESNALQSLQQQMEQMSKSVHSLIIEKSASHQEQPATSKLSLSQEVSLPRDPGCENEALKNQISRLDDQLQEVIQMNARWQGYNSEREKYVSALQTKQAELEEKLVAANKVQISEEQQQRIDRLIQEHKKKIAMIEDSKIKVDDENRMLRQEIERYRQQVNSQQQDLSLMEARIRDLTRPGRQQGSDDDRQTIDLQRAQIKLLTEDFESERRDRQAVHQKLSCLEREHALMKERLSQYQGRQHEDLMASRQRALEQYQNEYLMRTGGSPHPPQQGGSGGLIARGKFYADGESEEANMPADEDGDYDEIDYAFPLPQLQLRDSGHRDVISSPAPVASNTDLECPCCHRKFSAEQYMSLLEHIDVCGN
ncbi:hypothetical protein CAPTEDRAFT_223974 [Capitella teleta]|uniref:CCHC NOA-type domain-containing protein n=1 Tax=Capitella teleta TaxID=283909 RepID=R7V152_CAPTE|nr:hypothetical protein CAPTEDRAFT_223974 [Capitella teleta]|eukprot:ELU09431.1 hypothetical protein CAPTEDRAFT_223974 [Capitella teleta]